MKVPKTQTFRYSVVKSQGHQQGNAFKMVPKCMPHPLLWQKYMRQYNLRVKGFILAQGFRGLCPTEKWAYGRTVAHTVLEKNQKRKYRNIGPPLVLPLFYFLFHRVGVWLGATFKVGFPLLSCSPLGIHLQTYPQQCVLPSPKSPKIQSSW